MGCPRNLRSRHQLAAALPHWSGEVYTLKGRWVYSEYPDQPQTAGSYLYEPGGSAHTLYVPEGNTDDTVLFVRVSGANINFDDNGIFNSILDAVNIRFIAEALSADQDLPAPRYIEGGETGLSEHHATNS